MTMETLPGKISPRDILFVLIVYIFTPPNLYATPNNSKVLSLPIQPLQATADFIYDMKVENRTVNTISDVEQSNTYTDEELAHALTAIAVSKNGDQFSSSISISQLKQFSPTMAIEQYSNDFNHPLAHYAEILDIENAIKPMIVMGSDNRKQVTNTVVSSPFWHIGKLDIGCTGTLIGNNVVITAGHCISNGDGIWYNNLDFTVAQNGTYIPWKKCAWKTAITTEAWHRNSDSNFDYGLIILDCIANGGWLGFGPFVSGEHSITGYASEKPYATMWTDEGPVTSTTYRLCYQIDTSNGVSGSAIVDSQHYIRGVHTTGSSSRNCGTKITYEVYSTIHYWMDLYQ
ncbi:trypsin-like serine protease [uncultured Shewanella sp.]|uniref:trypsin-like serine peptidase n=1 Tax=uncultured Shewanella sp. TaxID=173975 RepID=UPI00260EEAA8|nr:trypsin-like serine protease [uncultured Shewanella sp.]